MTDVEQAHAWTSDEDKRKLQWNELLQTPLLLSLMKRLAMPNDSGKNELQEITNRFTLYRRAIRHILRKGARTIEGSADLTKAETKLQQWMAKVAQTMLRNHNFDVLEGDEFDDLDLTDEERTDLIQADLLTEHQILERVQLEDIEDAQDQIRRGVEWRHRSFLEFLGASSLAQRWSDDCDDVKRLLSDVHACLEEGQIRTWPSNDSDSLQRVFRHLPADWQWTLRFLLAHLQEPARSEVALEIIAAGNPWVVYDVIDEDHTELTSDVDTLCRWLVSRNFLARRDYRKSTENDGSEVATEVAREALQSQLAKRPDLVNSLLMPQSRDAGMIFNLREIAGDWNPEQRKLYHAVASCRQSVLDDFLRQERWLTVPDHNHVQLADFPVTNAAFEAYCASHHRFRDSYSSEDDQPALYISWYMANEFCRWLSEIDRDHQYQLPPEDVWLAACRWGTSDKWDYWWGNEMRDELCWYRSSRDGRRTRSRTEAIEAFSRATTQHPSWTTEHQPGLLDMLGNVWEWSANARDSRKENDPGSSRVLRGGSWINNADLCRSAYRYYVSTPGDRYDSVGFRICRM